MATALDGDTVEESKDQPGNMMKNLPNLGLTSNPRELKEAMEKLKREGLASPKPQPKKLDKERKKSTFTVPKKPSYIVPHDAKYLKKLRYTKSAERPRRTIAMMQANPDHFLY